MGSSNLQMAFIGGTFRSAIVCAGAAAVLACSGYDPSEHELVNPQPSNDGIAPQPSSDGTVTTGVTGSGSGSTSATNTTTTSAAHTNASVLSDSTETTPSSSTPLSSTPSSPTHASSSSSLGASGVTTTHDESVGESTSDGVGSSTGSSATTSSNPDTTSGEETSDEPLVEVTVFLAGDSTVSQYTDTASETDQAGWGQMLHEYLDERAHVDNRAIGGRTARRFIDEGALDAIAAELSPGDFLLVQFGTNDGNRTATYELDGQDIPYYLEPDTDFKTYLSEYIDVALEHDATPIFVTPPPRNSAYCTGGNGTGAHAEAMRALGMERGVAVVDLNARSVEYLTAICPAPTPEDFFLLRSDGTVDGTHFQENGARVLASFVASELMLTETRLGDYVLER